MNDCGHRPLFNKVRATGGDWEPVVVSFHCGECDAPIPGPPPRDRSIDAPLRPVERKDVDE